MSNITLFSIINSEISGNSPSAISVFNVTTFQVSAQSKISDNGEKSDNGTDRPEKEWTVQGGGVRLEGVDKIEIEDSEIKYNHAAYGGGMALLNCGVSWKTRSRYMYMYIICISLILRFTL